MIELKVKNLQKIFPGGKTIFPKIGCSFELETSDIYMVLGGSGMGKSTLFKLILGIQNPTEGSSNILVPYSFLLTENNFDLELSLEDNFREYYDSYNLPFVEDYKDIIGKTERVSWSMLAKNCSFGTLRRFALYRVLFEKGVKLCFLDQPTTGADINNIKKLKQIIKEKSNEVSFFIVTHDKNLTYIATKLLLLSEVISQISTDTRAGFIKLNYQTYFSQFQDVEFRGLKKGKIIYKNSLENNIILMFKDQEDYNKLGAYLKSKYLIHKSSWKGDKSLYPFINTYF